jgi:hypothetical protein
MTSSAPPSLYAHPDPLLSRLRLNGSSGQPLLKPTSPDSELRDAAVIAFVFGEQVHRENQDYGKKLYKVRHYYSTRGIVPKAEDGMA